MKPEIHHPFRELVTPVENHRKKSKGFNPTKEFIEIAKQEYFLRGGTVKKLEPELYSQTILEQILSEYT